MVRKAGVVVLIVSVLGICRSVVGVTVYTPYKFPYYGTVRNDGPQSKGGICAAAATINSFAYLINRYPQVYGGTNLIPDVNANKLLDLPDLESARDKLARGWAVAGNGAGGIYGEMFTDIGNGQYDVGEPFEDLDGSGYWEKGEPFTDIGNGKWDFGETYDDYNGNGAYDGPDSRDGDECWWVNKLWWIDDHAPNTTVVDGQVQGSVKPQDWIGGSVLEDMYPTWTFLWGEMIRCEDVELGIVRVTGSGGHVLTLTRLCFVDDDGDGEWDIGEKRAMSYLDPNGPAIERTVMLWEGDGGRFEFNWWQDSEDWFIQTAYAESPVPEPLTALGFSAAVATIGFTLRRRYARGIL